MLVHVRLCVLWRLHTSQASAQAIDEACRLLAPHVIWELAVGRLMALPVPRGPFCLAHPHPCHVLGDGVDCG